MNHVKHSIILFDGVCNFCNYWVNFIIDRDVENIFKFAALQSEKGHEILEKFNLSKDDFDSFILISNDKVYNKSVAALKIAGKLRGWPKLLVPFQILPPPVTDLLYGIIAKNRYKIFGKREACRIPTPEERARFL